MILSTKRPSDRKFGFTFAVVFIAICLYGVFGSWSPTASGVCALVGLSLFIVAAAAPELLAPLNRAWFTFGELLGRIVSPLALGLIFFAAVTPIAIIARLLGRDELRLKRHTVPSYWVLRQTRVLDPQSFKQQF